MSDLKELFDMLDPNKLGIITIDEFCKGCQKLKGVAKSKDLIQVSCMVGHQIGDLAGLVDLQTEKNEVLDNVIDRLNEIDQEYFQDQRERKKARQLRRKGPPSNAAIEDKIDAASVG